MEVILVTEQDQLTPAQLELWDELGTSRPIVRTPYQTREQAWNFAVASFGFVCAFEGVGIPSEAAVEAEFRRRKVAVLDPSSGATADPRTIPRWVRKHFPTDWDFERYGAPPKYVMEHRRDSED